MRERARALGDVGLERACNADLVRHGYRDQPLETTAVAEMPEHAVPEKPRRGRPPRPRCEHDMIADRCPECNDDNV